VQVCSARPSRLGPSWLRRGTRFAVAGLLVFIGCESLQNAGAEGDTRTLTFHHTHRGDDLTITFKRNGRYDDEALKKLNYYLRDWRNDATTEMDPSLFDIIWEVTREVDASAPINIVSSYRSPQTNSMLRRRSRGVARYSQHMLGKAMDFYIPGVSLEQIRIAGLRLQRGGVGFYPTSGSPFVHLDTGNVRHWPRMTHDQLARVFPDGRTVHIPSDGQPLRNYSLALADLQRHGGHVRGTQVADHTRRNFFAKLLGIGSDDEDEAETRTPRRAGTSVAALVPPPAARQETAAAVPMPRTRPQPRAGEFSLASAESTPQATPAQVIAERGIWDNVAPPRPPAAIPAATADANNPNTATGDPQRFGWLRGPQGRPVPATPRQRRDAAAEIAARVKLPDQPDQNDRVPTELVLAYAANAGATPAVRPASYPMGSQRSNALIATRSPPTTVPGMWHGQSGGDPWLRGIVMAPSVQYSMRVAVFGGTDPRTIRPYMLKPSSSVYMGFSDDPQFGMTSDYFSGSAVAFLPTVNFIRTAGIN
jgi:uncharacterized protein YcbK (DUF882 family)